MHLFMFGDDATLLFMTNPSTWAETLRHERSVKSYGASAHRKISNRRTHKILKAFGISSNYDGESESISLQTPFLCLWWKKVHS